MAWIEERERKKGIVYKTYWRDISGITRRKISTIRNADTAAFYEAIGYTHDDVVSLGRRLVHDEAGQ